MKRVKIAGLCLIMGCAFASGSGLCQGIDLPKDVLDRLQDQPQAEARKITTVPTSPASSAAAGAGETQSQKPLDADGMRKLGQLLDQVEKNRGAQSGTIKAISPHGAAVSLQYDLPKIRQNFSVITDAPFGKPLAQVSHDPTAATATTPAAVEYKESNAPGATVSVISIKSHDAVAANAFASGDKPVSVKVNNANLTATQVPGSNEQLAVDVKVGNETRRLNVGDVSQFGNVEVKVLASTNRANKPSYEGLPYALRLSLMPMQ